METKTKILIGVGAVVVIGIIVMIVSKAKAAPVTPTSNTGTGSLPLSPVPRTITKTGSGLGTSYIPQPTGSSTPPPNTSPSPSDTNTIILTPFNWTGFDWVGKQDNKKGGSYAGIHLTDGMLQGAKTGDTVIINVLTGEQSYNGEGTIAYIGADDGTYTQSIITITKPYAGSASGQIRLKFSGASADGQRIY